MKTPISHSCHLINLARHWLHLLTLTTACISVHAQEVTEQVPTNAMVPTVSSHASIWLPNGALSSPELSNGVSVSAMNQSRDSAVQEWQVRRADVSVRRMLQRWASEAGWQLVWDAPRDFPIETELQLSGHIDQVVSAVVESLAITDYPVQARINSELQIIRIGSYLESKAR